MTGRVRNHRRPSPADGVYATVAVLVFCLGLACARGILNVLALEWPALTGVVLATGAGYLGYKRWRRHRLTVRARREMAEWRASSGWTEVPPPAAWPWTSLQRWPDVVTVLNARARTVDGFPVKVGQISWTEDGLGRTVDRYAGSGLFVLVRLPQPVPSMAVRGYRKAYRRRSDEEDEFRRRFETVGFDSYRFDGPAFRAVHVRGDVPLWTVIDRDLFAFVPLDEPLTPGAIDSAVRRTLRVVELMEFGPDGAMPPDDDVPLDATPPQDDVPLDATPPHDDVPPSATPPEDDVVGSPNVG
jgi:hypothetical protein